MKYKVLVNEKGTFWYKEGTDILHREDGPAREWANGGKSWYINGGLHRIDGPAIEWSNGSEDWFYQGQEIDCESQEEFEIWLEKNYPKTLKLSKPKHLLKPQI